MDEKTVEEEEMGVKEEEEEREKVERKKVEKKKTTYLNSICGASLARARARARARAHPRGTASARTYQFFNSNSHCGGILCHKKIGARSHPSAAALRRALGPSGGREGVCVCVETAVMRNAFVSTFLHS